MADNVINKLKLVLSMCLQSEEWKSGVLIELMDWFFGLVRKKSAGANLLPPRHKGTMFAEQEKLDPFVDEYGKNAQESPVAFVLYFLPR